MMVSKLTLIFKFIEPLFWFGQAVLLIILLKPRFFFEGNVKILDQLLSWQGFDAKLQPTEKSFRIWRRDLRILFFFNPWIIVLIHLI